MKTEYEFTEVLRFSPRIRFRSRADLLVDDLPVLDEQNRRDVADGILHGDRIVRIDVAFADRHSAFVFAGQFVDDRSDHPAGPHHSAQKSITSGLPESSNPCRFSDVIVSAIISVFLKFMFHCGRTKVIITSDKKHAATAKVINNLFNIPTGRRIHTYGSNSYISVYCNA